MSRIDQEIKTAASKTKTRRAVIFFVSLCAFFGIMGGFVYWTISDLPKVNAIQEYVPIESSKIYSCDGKLLAELYYERRTFVPHYKIPDHVKKAFVSIEDIRFYQHPGVDIRGVLRALIQDIRAGSIVQGGSTITQQLAKMLFLKPERSFTRKIKEAVLSIQIEKRFTKDEILGLYLNQTYFGTRAFGIEAAAQTYFGKSVNELSIAEAALLASLPKAPSMYSPFKNPLKSKERRSIVLESMLKHKFITSEQYNSALQEPIPESPFFRKYEAPYFIETLRQQLEDKYGPEIYTSGYKIYSTIDLSMQHIAEDALMNGVESIEKRKKPGIQAALIAIDIRTGHIKAMVGGFDFWQTQYNRATQALRQPGSAFKPFVYLTAIESGMTSEDTIDDSPISFKSRPGHLWSPGNYNEKYLGTVTLKTAMAKSLNVATVRLADRIGVRNIIKTARKLGIKSELHPYLSIALGASDIPLIEMVNAYSVFASGKRTEELISYESIQNRDGIVVDEVLPKITDILDDKTVNEMKILLGAVVTEGTAVKAKALGRTVYGKTGTTNDFTDAWFIGFDDNLVVGVWVGRDDHTPIGHKETGSSAALPIWIDFMKKVGADTQAVK